MQSSVDIMFDTEQRTHQSMQVTHSHMARRIEYKAYDSFVSSIKLFLVRLHLLIFLSPCFIVYEPSQNVCRDQGRRTPLYTALYRQCYTWQAALSPEF
jgi:hypothetical protein